MVAFGLSLRFKFAKSCLWTPQVLISCSTLVLQVAAAMNRVGVNHPFQRSRLKIQFAFCFGIRYTSHLSTVVNSIRTTFHLQSILNRYLWWWWSIQPLSKRSEPFAHRMTSIVSNQINTRIALLCCCNGSDSRILHVQPRPYAITVSHDRELLLPHLLGNITIGPEPGDGAG